MAQFLHKILHREKEIGGLVEEKLADVVFVDIGGPCMVVSMDLAATVVMHAIRANVETMIVNAESGF